MREFIKILLAYVFIALLFSIPLAFIYVAARLSWDLICFLRDILWWFVA